jgi:ABC-type cobalamin/Fe3+-siderophores transport system ATPase subunit
MELAERAIEKLGIAHIAGKPMDSISDGERQKVAIARALCQDTPLLFLDEPTAFLDFASKQALMALFREEASNRRIVFSTHDLHLLQGEEVELLVVEGKEVKCYDAKCAQQILARHIAIHRESMP